MPKTELSRRKAAALSLGLLPLPLPHPHPLPLPLPAIAQSAWPSRDITLVVPFPPGGQADLAARPIAEALRAALSVGTIVDNRAGAGGAAGNAAVARANPDGHTLLVTLSSLAVLPEAARLFGREIPYEMDQLVPVARILADPTVLAVPASEPWQNLDDFIKAAKADPGKIPYGSSGPYGTLHVAMEMFAAAAGIKLLHVPYRGAGPALADLLAGQIKALASAPGVLKAHVDAGKLRILANWGASRVPAFPDVKTFRELGFPDVEFYIWAGLFAPKGLPEPVLVKLRQAMAHVMQEPRVLQVFETAGSPPAYLDSADFAAFVKADSFRLIEAVKKIGKVE